MYPPDAHHDEDSDEQLQRYRKALETIAGVGRTTPLPSNPQWYQAIAERALHPESTQPRGWAPGDDFLPQTSETCHAS